MRLHIILFVMIQIKFGKTSDPIFRHCQFCIELQQPMGEDYDGPYPDQEEVSNLQKNRYLFFPNFSKKYKNHFDFFR